MATQVEALYELDDRQLAALDVLSAGGTHQEAADAAGVHRVTVSRWAGNVPAFIAERNRRRAELAATRASKVEQIDAVALDRLMDWVATGDPDALRFWAKVRGAEVMGTIDPGPQTAQEVVEQRVVQRRVERDAELERRVLAGAVGGPGDDAAVADDAVIRSEVERQLIDAIDAPGS